MRTIIITIAICLITLPGFAQKGGGKQERAERLKALKIGFITEKLALTPDEAKGFWPIYDEYEAKMQASRKAAKLDRAEARIYWDDMTDQQAEDLIDDYFARQQEELDLRESTTKRLKKVLPVKKVAQFWASEAKFRARVLKEIKNRQNQQGGQNGGRNNRNGGGRR